MSSCFVTIVGVDRRVRVNQAAVAFRNQWAKALIDGDPTVPINTFTHDGTLVERWVVTAAVGMIESSAAG